MQDHCFKRDGHSHQPFHSTTHVNDNKHFISQQAMTHGRQQPCTNLTWTYNSFLTMEAHLLHTGWFLFNDLNRNNKKMHLFGLESDNRFDTTQTGNNMESLLGAEKKHWRKLLKTPPKKSVTQNTEWASSQHRLLLN